MQYIDKQLTMPTEVEKWVKKTKPTQWNLSQNYREGYEILREQLRQEQHGLCCYCCVSLVDKDTRIEHLKCRDNYPNKTFDYENLLLSCATKNQCDIAKENQELPLTPLMQECDSEIKIIATGELEGETERANEAIDILNLNNDKLSNNRKSKYDIIFMLKADISLLEEISNETTLSSQTISDQLLEEQLKLAYNDTPEYQEFKYILNKIEAF